MRVCIIGGAGYVGLVTGLGLAEIGHSVTSFDVDERRLERLSAGEAHILEAGLEALLRDNLRSGRIRFSSQLPDAVAGSEVVFVAVGTPSLDDGQADLSQVIAVAEQLSKHLRPYTVVVIKSTVPVGTVELVRSILRREREEGVDFDVVSNPEFLREGKGLYDFFYPNRIVVGARSDKARKVMRAVYAPIIEGRVAWRSGSQRPETLYHVPVVETDLASAQMIKYASNAFLAARVSFVNEIASLCERVGADIKEVALGMGYDHRIGHSYLEPGLGFGGPCLEKDLKALIRIAEGNGQQPIVLKAILDRNNQQLEEVIIKVKRLTGHLLYKKIIAVFGLAFKGGTNDARNSLALRVIERLQKEGATVRAYDPAAIEAARQLDSGVTYCADPYEAVRHAEALLVLTDWQDFKALDYSLIKDSMSVPCIVDARNLLDADYISSLGLTYVAMGRQPGLPGLLTQ